ncbi:MAG TPA: hypothetical protein VK474_13325 [Chthoniobacterales bacterium]|nr:hypothetical protein [Chthoniobacterales bacterium]
MKQKIILITVATAFVATGLMCFGADELPKAPAFARYQPMMKRSPFAVATAVALPAATPNFAKDLYIANAARTSAGDLVTIASSTDKNFKKYLSTEEPVDGYSVPKIEWSDRVGATKVTISKDGQFATLTFNQALLSQAPSNFAPEMVQPLPGVPAPVPAIQNFPNPHALRPAPIPTLPTPPPRVRGVIQRNPGPVPVPPQPQAVQEEQGKEQ